jgi:small ligand-binding sensory domain FIST
LLYCINSFSAYFCIQLVCEEEVKIRLPRGDAAIRKMLKLLEEERAKLKERSIAELEREINERVYRLYGLDESDVKVIEEFLEKF